MINIQSLSVLILIPILSSCVFDDDYDKASDNQGKTNNYTYHAIDDLTINARIKGDFDGFMISSGGIDRKNATPDLEIHRRDLAGFVAERPALNDGNTAKKIADALELKLQNIRYQSGYVGSLSDLISLNVISEQTYAGLGAINKRLSLTFADIVSPTLITKEIAELFGTNKEDGIIQTWPSPDSDEPFSTEYSLSYSVIYINDQQIVTIASLTPDSHADSYGHILRSSTTPTNVNPTGSENKSNTQSYTAIGGGGKADFLFVIDDSGSMAGNQQAVHDAADIFSLTMQSSGLDYEIATITTGRTVYFRDEYQDGGFTTDLAEFKLDVTPGSSGSNTETGIYNAEKSLQSIALSDSEDGIVTQEGHPRANANLSVIILSDEPSQYTSRGNHTFDPNNNLFIDRQYRVYSVIAPSDNQSSQYDDLSNSSGGSVADINITNQFPVIFTEIATLAGAASSRYTLEFTPIESSIEVSVNKQKITRSNNNGWQYVIGSNAILFKGNTIPNENDKVQVTYSHRPTQNWWIEPASSVDALFDTSH